MLFDNICGINVNLIHAGIAVGIVDILSILIEIIIDIEFYFNCE